MRHRTATMGGYVSETTVDSQSSDSDASYTECHSMSVTVNRLAPAAEAGEDLADFNFADRPSSAGQAEYSQFGRKLFLLLLHYSNTRTLHLAP